MAKIYTRKGDDGTTGLFDGTRVQKDHVRTDAYGDVDECNAAIGAARAFCEEQELVDLLVGIQKDLLAIGAQLADPKHAERPVKPKTQITDERIAQFEQLMDAWGASLPPLRGFILRGGSKGGALLHVACCVCRRAERRVVGLARQVAVPSIVVRYLNRLADLMFVMARVENRKGGEEQIDW